MDGRRLSSSKPFFFSFCPRGLNLVYFVTKSCKCLFRNIPKLFSFPIFHHFLSLSDHLLLDSISNISQLHINNISNFIMPPFWAMPLHSDTIRLIVSSLSQHILHHAKVLTLSTFTFTRSDIELSLIILQLYNDIFWSMSKIIH